MKKRTLLAAALMGIALGIWCQGCAKVSLSTQCPANSTGVSFALAGSTVGNQLLSMLSSGLATGGLIAGARLGADGTSYHRDDELRIRSDFWERQRLVELYGAANDYDGGHIASRANIALIVVFLSGCSAPQPAPVQPWSVHPLPAATPAPCVTGVYSDVMRCCGCKGWPSP